ncbi:hypothetical protein [Nocardia vulneris]|uniref:Uncharacterized protein n=1 Tax=Nocardia vulneris TaxID=1141657 RepID=A0ABR4Z7S1_9NOCA|nr:hypothetical protein [Nocardia vulneris]KIA61313.1 hypothetical protein FG87_31585 [Nocardia vulneris]
MPEIRIDTGGGPGHLGPQRLSDEFTTLRTELARYGEDASRGIGQDLPSTFDVIGGPVAGSNRTASRC